MFAEQMLPRARERLATIDAGGLVRDAADLMSKPHTDLLVVCDGDGGMVGVLTKTDLIGQIGRCSGGGCTARAETIMTRAVVSCRPTESLQDIWLMMKKRGLPRIPLLDGSGKPIGILYARDVLQNLLGEVEDQDSLLRDYVMSIGYQ
ncbi:MAG: CBS domain-containing protein [Acetobacteraceae bacterium]